MCSSYSSDRSVKFSNRAINSREFLHSVAIKSETFHAYDCTKARLTRMFPLITLQQNGELLINRNQYVSNLIRCCLILNQFIMKTLRRNEIIKFQGFQLRIGSLLLRLLSVSIRLTKIPNFQSNFYSKLNSMSYTSRYPSRKNVWLAHCIFHGL